MKRWMKCLGALMLVTGIASTADAGFFHRGGCYTQAPVCESGPAMTYVTEYREVQRTVYKCVPTTTEQTINETIVTPVKTMEKKEWVVYEQKLKTEERSRTVYLNKVETENREVIVYRPFTENVTQDYYECVVTPRVETRQVTTYVPKTRLEERTNTFTTFKRVPEVINRTVTCYQQVSVPNPCYDPCKPWCGAPTICQSVPMTQTVPVTVIRCIPETQTVKVQVPVCYSEAVTTPVSYTVYDRQMVKKQQTVPVTTLKPVKETVSVQVSKTYPVVEKFNVQIPYTEAVPRSAMVEVITYKSETKPKKVLVTTFSTVATVVTEKVPVTICVPVCAPIVPCVK